MDIEKLLAVATSIRALSMDGVQKANSGHPGLPLGVAELGAVLYGEIMNHYPADSGWLNRDRFVLSAGHGSMFLYSLLHLSGYDVTLDDLKNFRQLGSRTPGHPEYGYTDGVETTTGPLGTGVGNAVGMAIASMMLGARFNTEKRKIIDHFVYALAGDGCLMEGVSSEAASLAGHLGLGNLIVFYDSNKITIEGPTSLAFSEDVAARFDAYGWQTFSGDAYDMEEIVRFVGEAKKDTERPTLIILSSVIGKGAPTKAGTHGVHGSPLGAEEIKASRKILGIPEGEDFFIHAEAKKYFQNRKTLWKERYNKWQETFGLWAKENPSMKEDLDVFLSGDFSFIYNMELPSYNRGDKLATRKASGNTLNALAAGVPNLVGGSADLAPSNNTAMPAYGDFSRENRAGRTLHFGVREHAMGAISNGIALYRGFRPFCSTFLVFADYMRPTIRLAALMKIPVIYVFTHDSIFVGEDGPTHQPVEHIQSLRIIPNVVVLRPGDAEETTMAWVMALKRSEGPTAIILTRQNLEVYEKFDRDWENSIKSGAYIVKDTDGIPDVVVVATGSEVNMALEGAKTLSGKKVRVVSMISRELFLAQDKEIRERLLPSGVRTVVVEAGVSSGWEGIASTSGDILSIDRFGESGPAQKVADHLGFNTAGLVRLIEGNF